MTRVCAAMAFLVALAACVTPRVLEDSPAACSNGLDDDGDGLIDCADDACASTSACERVSSTCSDGVDDDRDGLVDCEQKSCIDGGFCEPVPASCDVVRQTGCVRGMSCQPLDPASGLQRVCTRPGIVEENVPCSVSRADPSGGCGHGTICASSGLCSRPCVGESDCPRSATCFRATDQPYGVCTLTCFPTKGCANGYTCVALQRLGVPYAAFGWMHGCIAQGAADGLAAKGTAKVAALCVDGAFTSTPPERVCESGLLCAPEPAGAVCREVCPASEQGNDVKSCGAGRCVAIDPFDRRPPRSTERYRFGVCLP